MASLAEALAEAAAEKSAPGAPATHDVRQKAEASRVYGSVWQCDTSNMAYPHPQLEWLPG